MKITKLEKQKRLYLLQIDQTEELYITEDTIVRYMLSKDMEITEEQLTQIKMFAQYSEAKNFALYYLSFKQRTKKEVTNYLKEKEFNDSTITQVLKELETQEWINETRYVETYLRQNLSTSDKGPYVILQKLKEKGISEHLITAELEKTDFSELLTKLITKYVKKYQHKVPKNKLFPKIQQTLTQKGFHYTDINKQLNKIELEYSEDTQNQLLQKELVKLLKRYQRKYSGYDLKQHLIQALLRKGFDYDDIKSTISQINL